MAVAPNSEMTGRWPSLARSVLADEKGSTAILYALMLTVSCGIVGLALDFSQAFSLQRKLQETADSAALAAVSSVWNSASSNSVTTTAASAIGQVYWDTATKGAKQTGSATVSTTNFNGVVTTSVEYSGSQSSSFGALFGVRAFPVNGLAVAQAESQATRTLGLSGSGDVWGDPHIDGADTSKYIFQCPPGNWYNLLSDAGIEINVSCYPIFGEQIIDQVSILLRTSSGLHNIRLSNPQVDPVSWLPLTTWYPGQLTVDGATFTAPNGISSYFDGTTKYSFNSTSWNTSAKNVLTITLPQYVITVYFNRLDEHIEVKAIGAGKCAPPGGFWGGTLIGIDSNRTGDFLIKGPDATAKEFNGAPCSLVSGGPHLIK